MKSVRSRAADISPSVRQIVKERDKHCIFCGKKGTDIAHFIPRSRGGKGVPENLVLACHECHMKQHSGEKGYLDAIRDYLSSCYDDWKMMTLTYHNPKWDEFPLKTSYEILQKGG